MTTIVAVNTPDKQVLVADTLITGTEPTYNTQKIWQIQFREQTLTMAGCGDYDLVCLLAHYLTQYGLGLVHLYDGGQDRRAPLFREPGASMTAVVQDGKDMYICDENLIPSLVVDPFICLGSGADMASHVMNTTGDPFEAVEQAMEIDPGSGGSARHWMRRK